MAETSIIVKVVDQATAKIDEIKRDLDRLGDTADTVSNNIKNLVAAYVSIGTARVLLDQINTIQELDNKIRTATKSQEDFARSYNEIYTIAKQTRAPLTETGDLYTKIARSSELLGLAQDETAKVTKAFNLALSASGAGGAAAAGAITQFAQALQSGKFQGDEFRSISETIPQILDVISKRTGIAREDLKEYASKGLLTGKVAALALIESLGDLEQQFSKTTPTIKQSFTVLTNEFQNSLRAFDEASGFSDKVSKAILFLADNMDNLIPIAKAVGMVMVALGVYIAPVAAAFVAGTAAVLAFADKIGPLVKIVVSLAEDAIGFLIKQVVGLVAALKAIAQGDNPFTAYTTAVENFGKKASDTTKSTEGLSDASKALGLESETTTGKTDRMTAAMNQANAKALEGAKSYSNFVESLKMSTEASSQDADTKAYATKLLEAYRAKATDLKIGIAELSDTQKAAIEQEVGDLIRSKIANENAAKAREQAYKDSASYLAKYSDEFKRYTDDNLTFSEKANKTLTEIDDAYNKARANSLGKTTEELSKLEQDYQNARTVATQKALSDLAKEYQKYSDSQQTDAQKLSDELTKIEDAYRLAGIEGETNYHTALQGIRDKAYAKYKGMVEDMTNWSKTNQEQLNTRLLELEEEFRAANAVGTEEYLKAREALIFKYNKSILDEGKKYLDDQLTNEQEFAKRVAEIEEAKGKDSAERAKYYDAAKLAATKKYIEDTVSEYSTLYNDLNDQILKFTGQSQEQFERTREIVKLIFGVDIKDIIKEAFAALIRYVIGFREATNSEMSLVPGILKSAFSDTSPVSSWIDTALNLFKGFSGSVGNIFSGIGSFIGKIFSSGGGGSIIDTISSGLGSIVSTVGSAISGGGSVLSTVGSAVGSVVGSVGSAIGSVVSTVGSAIGLGSGAAAGGAAAAGGGIMATIGSIAGGLLPIVALGGLISAFGANEREANRAIANKESNIGKIATAVSELKKKGISYGKFYSRQLGVPDYYALTDSAGNKGEKRYPNFSRVDSKYSGIVGDYNFYSKRGLSPDDLYLYYMAFDGEFGAKGLAYGGGIINKPTIFGTRSGMAVGGELGTEAIMPLGRDSQGRLGVYGDGSGQTVNVNFTINAVDTRGIDQLLNERKSMITNLVRDGVREKGYKFSY